MMMLALMVECKRDDGCGDGADGAVTMVRVANVINRDFAIIFFKMIITTMTENSLVLVARH